MRKAVYYVQYFNPAALPPLEHGALLLKRAGYRVFLSGIAEANGAGRITIHPELTSSTRLWRARAPGWRQKVHFLTFGLYHLWNLAKASRQWIYASDPLICPFVCLVKLLRLGPVVYHEHDSPDPFLPARKWTGRLMARLRVRAARDADLVVLPNRERALAIERLRPGRPSAHVVWNCPRTEEVGPARPAWNGNVLKVLYHGSIVPDRLPLTIIEAVARFRGKISLSVVGYFPLGSQDYADVLQARIRELGAGPSVEIVGVIAARADMLRFAASHDAGLAFMPSLTRDINMQHMTGASNKAFDYLSAGLALLVSDLPDWKAFYADPGYALACNPGDADSITVALQRFLNDPARMREMGECGRQRILSEWNYESQFAPVMREMKRLATL